LLCLAKTHDVDILLLAEYPPAKIAASVEALTALGVGSYRAEQSAPAKVLALTRLAREDFVHQFTSLGKEMAIWKLRAPKLQSREALLVGVHLPSKAGGNNETDQASVAMEVIKELASIEDEHNHRNTALVGDFNMQPYDPGMTMVTGFNGLMTRALAELPDRVHRTQARRRFYNPMWGLFGDRTPGPAGSYYWHSSVLHNTHWEMLDQVLLRSPLANHLVDLRVLDNDGNHTLVGRDGGRRNITSRIICQCCFSLIYERCNNVTRIHKPLVESDSSKDSHTEGHLKSSSGSTCETDGWTLAG